MYRIQKAKNYRNQNTNFEKYMKIVSKINKKKESEPFSFALIDSSMECKSDPQFVG